MTSQARIRDTRSRELAKIHLAAAQLGMDTHDKAPESDYRRMLWSVARVHSAADLDEAGRHRVLAHLKSAGFRGAPRGRTKPAEGKEKLVAKVRAMLAAAGRLDAYADSMSRHMFRVDRFEWLTEDQLRRLVAALVYDAKRRERKP